MGLPVNIFSETIFLTSLLDFFITRALRPRLVMFILIMLFMLLAGSLENTSPLVALYPHLRFLSGMSGYFSILLIHIGLPKVLTLTRPRSDVKLTYRSSEHV